MPSTSGETIGPASLAGHSSNLYALLRRAVAYDASFSEPRLLEIPLEEGRIYGNRRRSERAADASSNSNTSFEEAVTVLQVGSCFPSLGQRVFWWVCDGIGIQAVSQRRAITPTVLSGLCSLVNSAEDESTTISVEGVSSSDLVLFCQNLRFQALQELKRRQRRQKWFLAVFLPIVIFACFQPTIQEAWFQFEESMTRAHYFVENTCANITDLGVQKACVLMETMVFHILQNESEFNTRKHGPPQFRYLSCRQQIQEGKFRQGYFPICNPGTFAMHLRLKNETVPLPLAMSDDDPYDILKAESNGKKEPLSLTTRFDSSKETVVNTLIRQAFIKFSQNYANQQSETVLDMGSGLGATLLSLIPLVSQNTNPQVRRPTRRQSTKKPMISYHGVTLNRAELHHANVLVEQYLIDIKNEGLLNVTYELGNMASPDSPGTPWNRGEGKYSAVLAIESLSYLHSKNYSSLLRHIHNSLQKGGLFIMVDDIVLPRDPNAPEIFGRQTYPARMEILKEALVRPTLMRHLEWMQLFHKTGFKLVETRDLTLEYNLLTDEEEEGLTAPSQQLFFFRLIVDLFERAILMVMMQLLQSIKGGADSYLTVKCSVVLRMALLRRNLASCQMSFEMRKQAYIDGDIGYNWYVLKK